jgi:hypothetical protein
MVKINNIELASKVVGAPIARINDTTMENKVIFFFEDGDIMTLTELDLASAYKRWINMDGKYEVSVTQRLDNLTEVGVYNTHMNKQVTYVQKKGCEAEVVIQAIEEAALLIEESV